MPAARRPRRRVVVAVLVLGMALLAAGRWSHLINAMLPADCRPGRIPHATVAVDAAAFDALAAEVRDAAVADGFRADHVDYFADAGLRAYAGPATCLGCHAEVAWAGPDGAAHAEGQPGGVGGAEGGGLPLG